MSFLWRQKKYLFLALLLIASVCVWVGVFQHARPGVLTLAVLDVGQGDAIFIESPTGVQLLIDGGPDNSLLRELPKVMPFSDRSLDAVIESHPDADHIAGFVDLLKRYRVDTFISPGIPKGTLTAKTLEKEIDTRRIPRILARRGMWLDMGGGAHLTVLFPDFDTSTLSDANTNEGAIVARVVYRETSILLMADVSKNVEDHLLQISTSAELESDVLKVGHHGSAGSSADAFVSAVNPRVAIISVGAQNRYGHPRQATLDTLSQHNIQILRTDQEGTIMFISNGKVFERVK